MPDAEEYDFVIIGTGLAETALSQVLASTNKYKILHIDTEKSYGSEFTTLRYLQLLEHFGIPRSEAVPELEARNREFNIDITPKLLLRDSPLKEFLVENKIHELATFTAIKESYLFTERLHSIPRNEAHSLRSRVVSLFQKPRVIRFFWHVRSFFDGGTGSICPTMRDEFQKYGLNDDSIDFIGHAIALNLDDKYLDDSPLITYDRIVRYVSSIAGFSGTESPYLYPHYGLSEICQAFVRRSAVCGTTFMLSAEIKKIGAETIKLLDPDKREYVVKYRKIIADPKYIDGSRVTKKIIRCILIVRREKRESRSIIFLKRQLKRKNDIFCVVLGADEMVCPKEYEVAILSTVMETDNPEQEMSPVTEKFTVIQKFLEVRDFYENDDTESILFTKTVDESALMDNIYDDFLRVLQKLE